MASMRSTVIVAVTAMANIEVVVAVEMDTEAVEDSEAVIMAIVDVDVVALEEVVKVLPGVVAQRSHKRNMNGPN